MIDILKYVVQSEGDTYLELTFYAFSEIPIRQYVNLRCISKLHFLLL